jgi:hypothetical protein
MYGITRSPGAMPTVFPRTGRVGEHARGSGSVRPVFLCPSRRISLVVMKPQDARVGMRVKVQEHHRLEERRGLIGKVVGCYGGQEYLVVDVRLADGRTRLFWPADLEEVEAPQRWWRSLLG